MEEEEEEEEGRGRDCGASSTLRYFMLLRVEEAKEKVCRTQPRVQYARPSFTSRKIRDLRAGCRRLTNPRWATTSI